MKKVLTELDEKGEHMDTSLVNNTILTFSNLDITWDHLVRHKLVKFRVLIKRIGNLLNFNLNKYN
jgi:hypothetical protein